MTTGHTIEEETLRERKRPRKTATQATQTRKLFDGLPRKELPIPTIIDAYNHSMGQVDVTNQLRAPYTVHFSGNQKEFMPGIFWSIDMVNVNIWKIFEALHEPYLVYSTGTKRTDSHRRFYEVLVDLIFSCSYEGWEDTVRISLPTNPFDYTKFDYNANPRKRKAIEELLVPLRGLPGRPIAQYPVNFAPRVTHSHIQTTTRGYCIVCRSDPILIEQSESEKEASIPMEWISTFSILPPRDQGVESIPGNKRRQVQGPRGTRTAWKCDTCKVPVCKGRKVGKDTSCWDLCHRQIAH
jgi:hypothetical protein